MGVPPKKGRLTIYGEELTGMFKASFITKDLRRTQAFWIMHQSFASPANMKPGIDGI